LPYSFYDFIRPKIAKAVLYGASVLRFRATAVLRGTITLSGIKNVSGNYCLMKGES
jgi:hypothetical protein